MVGIWRGRPPEGFAPFYRSLVTLVREVRSFVSSWPILLELRAINVFRESRLLKVSHLNIEKGICPLDWGMADSRNRLIGLENHIIQWDSEG
jgi:hypothetical protein